MIMNKKHIVIVEPNYGGHHMMYVVVLANALLVAGHRVTLALDLRTDEAKEHIRKRDNGLLEKVGVLPLKVAPGQKLTDRTLLNAAAACLEAVGGDSVFFNCLDECASSMLRWSSLGMFPPKSLKGKISGIYLRPRFLDEKRWSLNNFIKKTGFLKLSKSGWFQTLFLIDEFIIEDLKTRYPWQKFAFLPDPWLTEFTIPQEIARKELNIPSGRTVFLHYGVGGRRKGLHLVLEAIRKMLQQDRERVYLICAGKQEDPVIVKQLMDMELSGHARFLNRYIFEHEEQLCFCATDVVLVPYIRHYGSSGILSRAAAAKRPVIASDYHLIGKRVAHYGLGYLFKHLDTNDLATKMKLALETPSEGLSLFEKNLADYAKTCSEEASSKAIQAGEY